MFGVRLREHHQFGIGRIATQFAEALLQVFDFIRAQRQAEAGVRHRQLRCRNALKRTARRGAANSARGVRARRQQRLRHRVVQQARQFCRSDIVGRRQADQVQAQAALDALHGDGRRRAGSRWPCSPTATGCPGAGSRTRLSAPGSAAASETQPWRMRPIADRSSVAPGSGFDEIDMPGPADAELGNDLAKVVLETVAAEGRQGRQALKDDHVRGIPWKRDAYSKRSGPPGCPGRAAGTAKNGGCRLICS